MDRGGGVQLRWHGMVTQERGSYESFGPRARAPRVAIREDVPKETPPDPLLFAVFLLLPTFVRFWRSATASYRYRYHFVLLQPAMASSAIDVDRHLIGLLSSRDSPTSIRNQTGTLAE
jgi:hypothetical protein